MVNPRFLLLGALLMMLSYEVDALDCSFSGLKISCPTALDNSDKVFCCSTGVSSLNVCCNIEDYMKENGPMIAGVVIGALVLLCLCTSVLVLLLQLLPACQAQAARDRPLWSVAWCPSHFFSAL
ncbi:hypothetical protein JTE90_019285 [Oedothorax gibbosus]|uniref:Uncharacterized protein n=1 Tax=Oedothorax gibbosus TaxID=931172 RepID=A0AAV6UVP3_9ARAC|nr:hypothetical protein JTE90_019285 [Oedothorax gibbosus]